MAQTHAPVLIELRSLLADTLNVRLRSLDFRFAFRCTLGVALPMLIAIASGHVAEAVFPALGALIVGFASRLGVHRSRVIAMAATAMGMALGAFVAGSASFNPLVELVIAVVWGYGAGLMQALGPAAGFASTHSIIALALMGQQPIAIPASATAAVLILAGGLFQTLLCVLSFPFSGLTSERRALACAFAHLSEFAARLPTLHDNTPESASFEALDSAVADIQPFASSAHVETLRALADEAHHIRALLAIITSTWCTSSDPKLNANRDVLARTSASLLHAIGEALQQRRGPMIERATWLAFDRAAAILRQPDLAIKLHRAATLSGQANASARNAISPDTSHTADTRLYRAPRMNLRSALSTLRANVTWDSAHSQFGVRLAIVLTIATIAGAYLHFPRAYWIAISGSMILRANFNATFSHGIARMLGTVVGALLASFIIFHPSLPVLLMIMLCALAFAYPMSTLNYALYSALMTFFVVCLLSLQGIDTVAGAYDRLFATLVGGISALGVYLLWPTWEAPFAPKRVADLLGAERMYCKLVLSGYVNPGSVQIEPLRAAQREVWRTRSLANASIARLLKEPVSPKGLPTSTLQAILRASEQNNTGAIALTWCLDDAAMLIPEAIATLATTSSRLDTSFRNLETALRDDTPLNASPPVRDQGNTLPIDSGSNNPTLGLVERATTVMANRLEAMAALLRPQSPLTSDQA